MQSANQFPFQPIDPEACDTASEATNNAPFEWVSWMRQRSLVCVTLNDRGIGCRSWLFKTYLQTRPMLMAAWAALRGDRA